MSFQTIENLITTYVNAISIIHGLPVRYENDPRETPTTGIWCKCEIDYGDSTIKEIGAVNSYRNLGNLILEIYNNIGLGTSASLRLIDELAAVFTEILISDSVKFKTPSVQIVGRVEDNYQINITCPFYVDN